MMILLLWLDIFLPLTERMQGKVTGRLIFFQPAGDEFGDVVWFYPETAVSR